MASDESPTPTEQERITAFCRAEHQLLTGKRALAEHKKPLLAQKRKTLESLKQQLGELGLTGVNIRVDQQCWKVCSKTQTSKQAVTPGMVGRALGAVPDVSTLEQLGDWVWTQLQQARTKVRTVLDLKASKVDLCTQLPPEANVPGSSVEEREEAGDKCRQELQAALTEHCRAKAELARLQQSYNAQRQTLQGESNEAHDGVLAYMERAQVALQPIRLGNEKFAMRRRTSTRCKPLTRQADIKSWIQQTLQQLVPGTALEQPLTPEQKARCTAELTERLVQSIPRNDSVHVALISQR